MRRLTILSLLLFGCATRLQEATDYAEACERKYPGQCGAYWAEVEREEAARDRRRAAQPARAYGAAWRQPGGAQCTSTRIGQTVQTNCY